MKKRLLLLILAIGISFAPAVFADGSISEFTRSNTAGQSFCQAGIDQTKDLDLNTSTNANGGNQGSTKAVHADVVD